MLTPQEAQELFAILKSLVREGMSIIFISHKLNEVLEIADRITVLRRGKKIETLPAAGATEEGLAKLMVGREVLLRVDKAPAKPGDVLLDVEALQRPRRPRARDRPRRVAPGTRRRDRGDRRRRRQRPDGARRGAHRPALRRPAARSRSRGSDAHEGEHDRILDSGIGHIPEDRHRRGLVLDFSLAENMALHDFDRRPYSRFGWLRPEADGGARGAADPGVRRARRRPATPAKALSGGNQQKVVVAREVGNDPRVLVAAQPTRGLDVGAIEFVHRRLVEERDEGRGVLLVSLELDEILSLSDRILVMYEGEVVGEYGPDVTEEELGVAMLGGAREKEAAA